MKLGFSIICATLLSVVHGGSAVADESKTDEAKKGLEAIHYQRRIIYHSPQTPGYTSWVYAWGMPDNSIMVTFYQATGPVEGRLRASMEVQEKLAWPHLSDPRRDMTGLNTCNVFLRSTNGGATWKKASEDAFHSPMNCTANGTTGLRDGTILRAVLGSYLCYDADLPRTGLVQCSTDGAKTWSKPTSLLPPDEYTVFPVGIHPLRDGRVVVLGGVSRMASDQPSSEYTKIMEPLLLVSGDGGKTWDAPIQVVPEENRVGWACEECDAVELSNGDLFWMFRRCMPEDADKPLDKRRHTYWQGVTEKHGDTWTPKWVGPSPFPNLGLPNLLATQEGVILLVNAGQWTDDCGKTWHPIKNLPAPAYYPKAIQLADGRILVFAHIGSDDPYGVVDQSIVIDSFKLEAR